MPLSRQIGPESQPRATSRHGLMLRVSLQRQIWILHLLLGHRRRRRGTQVLLGGRRTSRCSSFDHLVYFINLFLDGSTLCTLWSLHGTPRKHVKPIKAIDAGGGALISMPGSELDLRCRAATCCVDTWSISVPLSLAAHSSMQRLDPVPLPPTSYFGSRSLGQRSRRQHR